MTAADNIRLFETTTVENPTSSDIEITGIELKDSKNLRLKSFEIVLLTAESTGSGYSPEDRPILSSDTATLAPGQFASIVAQIEVVTPGNEGASSGLSIRHRALTDSGHHVMDAPVSLKMVPYGTTCT
ncbi:hypothetical protein V5R04_06870 [Jonesiaceae bacterium BS-20]|uniref:Uncharacterized protein n=1 Tax=Jonesiaceae bacterium BS-20 TaxID=3120821 RepID=A0AAU7DZW8_9MICO